MIDAYLREGIYVVVDTKCRLTRGDRGDGKEKDPDVFHGSTTRAKCPDGCLAKVLWGECFSTIPAANMLTVCLVCFVCTFLNLGETLDSTVVNSPDFGSVTMQLLD